MENTADVLNSPNGRGRKMTQCSMQTTARERKRVRERKPESEESKTDIARDLRKLPPNVYKQVHIYVYVVVYMSAYVCVCLTQLLKLSSHALGPWRERGAGRSLGWWWCCG